MKKVSLQSGNQSRPTGLVGCSQTLPGIAVEKFVKKMMVFEMLIGPLGLVTGMILILPGIIFFKNAKEPFGELVGNLFQVKFIARPGGELIRVSVTVIFVIFAKCLDDQII